MNVQKINETLKQNNGSKGSRNAEKAEYLLTGGAKKMVYANRLTTSG